MVTVYYLKRFLDFFKKMIEQVKIKDIDIFMLKNKGRAFIVSSQHK